MLTDYRSEPKSSTDRPYFQRKSNWFLSYSQKATPSCETLGGLTILTLAEGIRAKKQRRQLLGFMHKIPLNRNQLLVDISRVDDEDCDLPRLIGDLIAAAGRCRLDVRVAGVLSEKQALLELTRVTQFVRCYPDRREAICDFLNNKPALIVNSETN